MGLSNEEYGRILAQGMPVTDTDRQYFRGVAEQHTDLLESIATDVLGFAKILGGFAAAASVGLQHMKGKGQS